jgi:hypothetical protein
MQERQSNSSVWLGINHRLNLCDRDLPIFNCTLDLKKSTEVEMGFLSFIKDRQERQQSDPQQSQQQKPDVSQDISARLPGREASAGKPVGQLPEDVRSQALDLGVRLDQATQNIQSDAPALPQAPADATDSCE